MKLSQFKGNRLTKREKIFRLKELEREIEENEVDKVFIPYLRRINYCLFLVTTQCCTGHGKKQSVKRAHLDFRSSLSPEKTINLLLRPMEDKFGINIELQTDCKRLRYVMWLYNREWKKEIKYFMILCKRALKKENIMDCIIL